MPHNPEHEDEKRREPPEELVNPLFGSIIEWRRLLTMHPGSFARVVDFLPKMAIKGESILYDVDGRPRWWDGTRWVMAGSYILDITSTTLDIVNTAVETALYSVTISGGILKTDRLIRCTIFGDYLNNTAATHNLEVRVKYGATTLMGDQTTTFDQNANRRAWSCQILLGNANAVSSQVAGMRFGMAAAGAATIAGIGHVAALGTVLGEMFGTSAINSANDQTFAVTIKHDAASADISIRRRYAILELL